MWDGLGLIDFSLAPHYGAPHPEAAEIDRVVKYFCTHEMPYRTIGDGEALIVRERGVEPPGRAIARGTQRRHLPGSPTTTPRRLDQRLDVRRRVRKGRSTEAFEL
jgi:hypothetical protein